MHPRTVPPWFRTGNSGAIDYDVRYRLVKWSYQECPGE